MNEILLLAIYIFGIIFGYLYIIYLQANDKLDPYGDKTIALWALFCWPFSIPLVLAGTIIFIPLFLVVKLFEKLEKKLLVLFKKEDKL